MSSIKLGTSVRQIVPPPIEGVVIDKKFIAETDSFQFLVESPDTDGDGAPQTRWFEQDQIESTPGAQA